MIRIRTATILKTSAAIRSFRSLRHPVGPSLRAYDLGRVQQGCACCKARQDHQAWRNALGH
ncbi:MULTISPECIES: hypothetical protein [unclassified Thiocapsa]|uniref:hypothetical protein n=1 Tax=unclassified Thiocapsa TaxID=2641286 RepID=UPI0035B4DB73